MCEKENPNRHVMKAVTVFDNTFHAIFFHSLPPMMSIVNKNTQDSLFIYIMLLNIEVQVHHNASLATSHFKLIVF